MHATRDEMQQTVIFGHAAITKTVCRARFWTIVKSAISRLLKNDFEDFSDRVVPGRDLRCAAVKIVRHDRPVELRLAGR